MPIPIASRGDEHPICAGASLSLVNPGARSVHQSLEIDFDQQHSDARHGHVTVGGRAVAIKAGTNLVPVDLAPGTTKIPVSVVTPGVRCHSVPADWLPTISATLTPPVPGAS